MRAPDQAPIFKRVVQWIGMTERFIDRVSGHSARVGATQDLAAPDIDLAAITLAGGGWKSTQRRDRAWRERRRSREGLIMGGRLHD
jgi:hypothetical protein